VEECFRVLTNGVFTNGDSDDDDDAVADIIRNLQAAFLPTFSFSMRKGKGLFITDFVNTYLTNIIYFLTHFGKT
jgi:hypothetical protein